MPTPTTSCAHRTLVRLWSLTSFAAVCNPNDGAAYDPAAEEWRPIEDPPLPPLAGQRSVWTGEELLVLAGDDPDPAEAGEAGGEAAAYDPASDTWRSLAENPRPQSGLEPALADGVVYLVGGGTPDHGPDEGGPAEEESDEGAPDAAPPFLAYVIDDDVWLERPDPPEGSRRHHALAWTGAELLLLGGQADGEPAPDARWDPPAPAEPEESG